MNRQNFYARLWLMLGCWAILLAGLSAQNTSARETALRFLQEKPLQFELTKSDVSDLSVVSEYRTAHNGLTHVWVQQQHKGIPVLNGLFGLHVAANGEVFHLGHRFVNDLSSRVNTEIPSLSAAKALELAMADLGFTGFPVPNVRQKLNNRNFVFEPGAVSRKEIPVTAAYVLTKGGTVRLSWLLVIDQANTPDLWTIAVDAQNGVVNTKMNNTQYCNWGHAHAAGEVCSGDSKQAAKAENERPVTEQLLLGEQYNVFALPVESPIHGTRTTVTDPADLNASPFGWHDTNGQPGGEYTYSRGNNVWAFDDSANDNTPSVGESVDGGASLNFDFPFDGDAEPIVNREASITNLFYMNNMLHDVFYRFGFDEEARNFQSNNYGKGGAAGDEVYAQALDGSGVNNANFSTPTDGGNGRMQMYVWDRAGGKLVTVNGPGSIIGGYDAAAAGGWGGAITSTPVTGDVVFVNDGSSDASLGCNAPVNDVAGKIVMVDRGVCEFGRKALNAQQAGGIACIICNFEDATINMGAGAVGGQVNIPVVMMKKTDCDLLRQFAGAGLNISIGLPTVAPGPAQRDGSFDNGIVAHEYHHGVSIRLTGNGVSCLSNQEQMGEGWSDWAGLILTVEPGDKGSDKRGIGTYALYQDVNGQGIRRYPYSTDMSIAPLTYSAVPSSAIPHGVGEVWANMIWDLYWAMVEKYGWDADWNNTQSGNYRAIQLVVDGMKLQPCSPGFIDGRDAIMLADKIKYGGADTCLISSVFARRGLGYLASQGSSESAGDGIENFDPIPTCIKELKISKTTSTPLLVPGELASFEITVINHKDEEAAGVVVTDELPAGLTFQNASDGGVFNNGKVQWNLGAMPSGLVKKLTYTAKTDQNIGSTVFFKDLMETEDEWYSNLVDPTTGEIFILQSDFVHPGSGSYAWAGRNIAIDSDFSLETTYTFNIPANNPVLRFWHQYNTEQGFDAGFLEFQDLSDPQLAWRRVQSDRAFRAGYDGGVAYGTFAIPFLQGFSGNSNGWKQSYFDLSDYAGKTITFRFRFGSDAGDAPTDGGWWIDEIEMMNMVNYDGEACITSGGDQACARAPERGIIMQPATVSTKEPSALNQIAMRVQPNPASDVLNVSVGQTLEGRVLLSLVSADGRTVLSRNFQGMAQGQVLSINVQDVPDGVYTLRLQSGSGTSVEKVVIR